MSIQTKYEIGNTVYTIDLTTFKVKSFVIDSIVAHVSSSGEVSNSLFEKGSYDSHLESRCFATKQELLDYLTEEK